VTVTAGGKKTTTDNSGYFTLKDVSTGAQTVSVSLNGYFNDGRGSASVQVVAENSARVSDLVLVPTSNGEVFIWHLKASNSDYKSPVQKQLCGTIYFESLWTKIDFWVGIKDPSVAVYAIGRRYSKFKATVGVADDERNLNSQVVFKVIGDGNTLYQSQPLKVGAIENIDVDVSSVLTFQLQVHQVAGSGSSDIQGVWGDARFTLR